MTLLRLLMRYVQYYGFGPYAFQLLAGYDCPTYATFLNTSFHADEVSTTHLNSYALPLISICAAL
jgi:hypothetical protein